MKTRWYAGIPKEFRAKSIKCFSITIHDGQQSQASTDMRRYRDRIRKAYVDKCRPQVPGDQKIIDLWREGQHLTEIAKLEEFRGLKRHGVARRLEACHEDGLRLQKAFHRN